jgi:hypothetical protein
VHLERSVSVREGIPSYYMYDHFNFSLSSSQGEVRESRETISSNSPCRMVPAIVTYCYKEKIVCNITFIIGTVLFA